MIETTGSARPARPRCTAAAAVLLCALSKPVPGAGVIPDTAHSVARVPVYASGSEAEVSLTVSATDACIDIRALLAQQTTKLAAILDEKTLVDCGAGGAPDSRLNFAFRAPEVRRTASFVWEFVTCTSDEHCETLGELPFTVIPADLLRPVVDWSARNVVYVDDPEGGLAAFLDAHAIEYTETARAIGADEDVVQLIVVSDPGDRRARDLGFGGRYKRRITFHDHATEWPLIRTESGPGGILIAVEMPVIRDLSRDAAHQKLFYELFQKLF